MPHELAGPLPTFRLHARDCAPCDAARAVVRELAVHMDPLDNWPDVEVGPDMSVTDLLVAVTAETLHNFPIGGPRG